ncbi:hypothetical protein BGX38DRAFT_1290442 [Terfezia claveryi]|nr:hypothetical protein BGX38DRAFT_1290442 [Terfezia claveryi]
MENVTIHDIKTNRCPTCIATKHQLGMLFKRPYRTRDHVDYQRLFQAGDVGQLDREGMKPLRNALWTQKGIIPPLMHLMEWIEGFLRKHKRLEAFDKIWENIPRILDTVNHKSDIGKSQCGVRAKKGADDREERQQAVHEILQQGTFNFPNLHLLSYYDSQIIDFGTLPQYSTEITEALHKPLKDAYRQSNHVDAAEQILDTVSRDYAIRMQELNLVAWSRDINLGADVLEMLANNAEVEIYRAGNENGLVDPLSVRPWKFQGDGESIHRVRWTGKEGFRWRDKSRADWVWIRRKERAPLELQIGQLDGRMVGRLEGLFSVHDETRKVHEVALVVLLRLRGPAKPSGEEGMIRVELREEWKRTHVIRIADIEGMAYLSIGDWEIMVAVRVCNEIVNIGDYEKMGWEEETPDTKETAEGPGRQGVGKACTGRTERQEVGKGRQGARKFLVRHRMPSETGSLAGCPQRQESQERMYKMPRETDRRRGRQQNISVSGRHYRPSGSQKILGKAQDALRDRKVRKGRTRCLRRQMGDMGGSKI